MGRPGLVLLMNSGIVSSWAIEGFFDPVHARSGDHEHEKSDNFRKDKKGKEGEVDESNDGNCLERSLGRGGLKRHENSGIV